MPVLSFGHLTNSGPTLEERLLETVVPFRAWRYAPTAGDPARLVAPPYDVIGPELQSRLYAGDPHNVVRVDFGMTTPSDNDCDNQYTRAAAYLAQWKKAGILVRDSRPTMTFVEESFTGPDGLATVRHGFLAAIRLFDYGEGVIFPHEETLTGPKEDRFRLMMSTAMNLSPVFLLYELPGDEITCAWKAGPGAEPATVTVTDDKANVTRMWPSSAPGILQKVAQSLAGARFIIADGHHRYETALHYRAHRWAKPDEGLGDRPAFDYFLAYFSNMADPALAIYATHRLVTGIDPARIAALPRSLSQWFRVERLTAGPTTAVEAQTATEAYLRCHSRGAFALWGADFDAAYGVLLEDQAAARAMVPEHSLAYQDLDVTVLQTLVLDKALGITPSDMAAGRNVTFCKDPGDAFAQLSEGEFQAGFFLNPTGLSQIREVAFGGERMPQKATYFYPKLPTGLVFHDLSSRL
jgi:uncharacterized protein (DUF1015 family)